MKPGLNSRIYFYGILNFLSSFIRTCEYVPRISTYLSNTLNARVTDLAVGKLSERRQSLPRTSRKSVRSKAFTKPAASRGSEFVHRSIFLFFFFLTLNETVSVLKCMLKDIPSK